MSEETKRQVPALTKEGADNLVETFNVAAQELKDRADTLEAKVDDAEQAASDLEASLDDAEGYALATSQFTDSQGNTVGQGAKGHAQDAEQAKQDAETFRNEAEADKDAAQQAATDAQNSADDALASSSFVDIVDTENDLSNISSPSSGQQALVRDDTANGNGVQAIYEYDGSSWSFIGYSLISEGQRDSADGFVGRGPNAFAATRREIYVSSQHGSDTNHGRTEEQPVKTLDQATSMMKAESVLYLERGSRWHEVLDLPDSSRMEVRPYGSGRRPIVDQSRAIENSGWTNVQGNIWKKNGNAHPP